MIAFKVRLNYQLLTVAGAEDMGVLSAILSGSFSASFPEGHHCTLHVGGLSRDKSSERGEFRDWVGHRRLTVGDFVSIEIVEAAEASPVVERRPAKRSPSIVEYEDVITLLTGEYLLLLHASKEEGVDLSKEDRSAASQAARLIELGLLAQRGGKVFASELGFKFLNNNETEREFVHRYRVPKE